MECYAGQKKIKYFKEGIINLAGYYRDKNKEMMVGFGSMNVLGSLSPWSGRDHGMF